MAGNKKMSDYELVHAITNWFDGARAVIADLDGKPHYFENQWLAGEQYWSKVYLLKSLDPEPSL